MGRMQRRVRVVSVGAVEGGRRHGVPSVRFAGVGSAIPVREVTNADLEAFVDTSDEWIATRTGIRSRRVVSEGERPTELAASAATNALEMAGLPASDVDMVILATSTPDDIFGGACLLQSAIGADNAMAFDVTAACSGFVVAVVTAASYIRCGATRSVLVVGADAMSRIVDWSDRSTCILFGDGAGAVVLKRGEEEEDGESGVEERSGKMIEGLLGFSMSSDGKGNDKLTAGFSAPGHGGEEEEEGHSRRAGAGAPHHDEYMTREKAAFDNVAMSGGDVFKFAVRAVPSVVSKALTQAELGVEDVDWLLLHQANQRILDSAADRLGVDHERVLSNLAKYGNTSAASIPLALDEAVREGKVKEGDIVAAAGFGAGLTWGSIVFRWG